MARIVRRVELSPEEEHAKSQIADLMEIFEIDEKVAEQRFVVHQVIQNHMAQLAIYYNVPIYLISYEVVNLSWRAEKAFPLKRYQHKANISRSGLKFNQGTMTWEFGNASIYGMEPNGSSAFTTEVVYRLVFASDGNHVYQ
jgi:hypothetical protein